MERLFLVIIESYLCEVKRKSLSLVQFFATPWTRVHGIFQARILDLLSLLQGIFSTQGLNPGLPHCRQILYQLNHKGSPEKRKREANGMGGKKKVTTVLKEAM